MEILKKVDVVAKTVQWLAALIGVVAFLVFFALAPLHALVLCGLLVVLGSMYFKLDKTVQQKALFLGVALMGIGVTAIFVPSVGIELLRIAGDLGRLLRLQP
jgi:hypothetical protein